MEKDIISRELEHWRSQRFTRVEIASLILMVVILVIGLAAVWSVQ